MYICISAYTAHTLVFNCFWFVLTAKSKFGQMRCWRIFVAIHWLWLKVVAHIFIDKLNNLELVLLFPVTSVMKDSNSAVSALEQ